MIIITAQQEVTYAKEKWVKVPKIYWNYTRKAVLTMEWIDGIKLNNDAALKEESLNRKELIDKVSRTFRVLLFNLLLSKRDFMRVDFIVGPKCLFFITEFSFLGIILLPDAIT